MRCKCGIDKEKQAVFWLEAELFPQKANHVGKLDINGQLEFLKEPARRVGGEKVREESFGHLVPPSAYLLFQNRSVARVFEHDDNLALGKRRVEMEPGEEKTVHHFTHILDVNRGI